MNSTCMAFVDIVMIVLYACLTDVPIFIMWRKARLSKKASYKMLYSLGLCIIIELHYKCISLQPGCTIKL